MKAARPLADMQDAAALIRAELEPYCERIEIAGSVRRWQPRCGDVELVAVPKFGDGGGSLFEAGPPVDMLDRYVRRRLDAGLAAYSPRLDKDGRKSIGPRSKRLLIDGVAVDLFVVLQPSQWGVIFAIRTGSAAFARQFVVRRGSNTKDGRSGLLPKDCVVGGQASQGRGGGVYRHDSKKPDGALLPMPEESDFFRLLGFAAPPAPEERT